MISAFRYETEMYHESGLSGIPDEQNKRVILSARGYDALL